MNEDLVIRKVQAYNNGRSVTIVLPRNFVEILKLGRGDYLKVSLDERKLVFQKADLN
jgi:antitoxin component of MazEF toxin-antitoxin module